MKTLLVSTICPFCQGSVMLSVDEDEANKLLLLKRLTGTQAECTHPDCGRSFKVRHGEIEVRRTE